MLSDIISLYWIYVNLVRNMSEWHDIMWYDMIGQIITLFKKIKIMILHHWFKVNGIMLFCICPVLSYFIVFWLSSAQWSVLTSLYEQQSTAINKKIQTLIEKKSNFNGKKNQILMGKKFNMKIFWTQYDLTMWDRWTFFVIFCLATISILSYTSSI